MALAAHQVVERRQRSSPVEHPAYDRDHDHRPGRLSAVAVAASCTAHGGVIPDVRAANGQRVPSCSSITASRPPRPFALALLAASRQRPAVLLWAVA